MRFPSWTWPTTAPTAPKSLVQILKNDPGPLSEVNCKSSFKMEIEFPSYLEVFDTFTLRVWTYN